MCQWLSGSEIKRTKGMTDTKKQWRYETEKGRRLVAGRWHTDKRRATFTFCSRFVSQERLILERREYGFSLNLTVLHYVTNRGQNSLLCHFLSTRLSVKRSSLKTTACFCCSHDVRTSTLFVCQCQISMFQVIRTAQKKNKKQKLKDMTR